MNFKEIDTILVNNSIVRFNYSILNPINKKEEFEKFLKDKTYNPQFEYKEFDTNLHIGALENLEIITDTPLGSLFEEIRKHTLLEATALKHIGTNNFDTSELFSKVSQRVIDKAKEILFEEKIKDPEEEKKHTDKELAKQMQEQLIKYDCHGWAIIFNKYAAARVSVSAAKKRVTIKKGEMFSSRDIKKLLVHEIGTHVLRAVNGEQQEYEVFALGLPHYLSTEEGLAGYNERSQGIKRKSTLRNYALSTMITHLCSTQGFVKVYNQVRNYFSDDFDCFRAVARVKRGIGDTSQPGGYLKDHCYLEGLMLIEDFVRDGGDIKQLYAGKIGVQHIHLVDVGVLKPAKIIPDFLK